MKNYQCTKKVAAFKIVNIIGNVLTPQDITQPNVEVSESYMKKHNPTVGGYYVLYEDGYESFSPAEAFENGYKEINLNKLLTFGEAIERLKTGALVAREGWNGKGMFIFMRPADALIVDFIKKIKSLPNDAKTWIDKNMDDKINPGEEGLNPVKFTAYLCMKAADNTIVNGWLASQTDILAEDWQELNP